MGGTPESDRVSFEIAHVRRKEITIQPVRRQNHCVRAAIDMAADGTVDLSPMITHEMPLDDVLTAFDIVDDYKDGVIKAMIHVKD